MSEAIPLQVATEDLTRHGPFYLCRKCAEAQGINMKDRTTKAGTMFVSPDRARCEECKNFLSRKAFKKEIG